MRDWIPRHIAWLIGLAVAVTIIGIGIMSAMEPTIEGAVIAARQVYGLTAFGFLMTACLIGPLAAVFPHIAAKGVLLAGRRAVGVSAFIIAIPHVMCYLGPVLLKNWRELFEPGLLWVVGLVLGLLALIDLTILAWTSRDAAVKAMGGKRWKRLHRSVYVAAPVLFLHALLVGTDFGFAKPAKGEADYGCLIVFSILTTLWLLLAWLRNRGMRWPARTSAKDTPARPTDP